MELGRAAIKAGAIDTGIDDLCRAVDEARAAGDDHLTSEALLAHGSALVHAVRGHDGKATSILHEALEISKAAGAAVVEAACHRELGYIEMLVGRYDRGLSHLSRALDAGGADTDGQAWTLAYQSICLSDTGRYGEAMEAIHRCLASGDETEPNPIAYGLCLLGRLHLLTGDLDRAADNLKRSIAVATRHGWTAFLAWPESLLAEVELALGPCDGAVKDRLERALSLAQAIGDPCWEGAAMRGLGAWHAAGGELSAATECLEGASLVCTRFPDSYLWMKAYALDALCDLGSREHLGAVRGWLDDLEALAAPAGMRDFLVRVYLYRAKMGEPGAFDTARALSETVDNPKLHRQLTDLGESQGLTRPLTRVRDKVSGIG